MSVHVPPPAQEARDILSARPAPTAGERALRAAEIIVSALKNRDTMTEAERLHWADEYDASAQRLADLARDYPAMLEFAGLRSLAAKIMRAEG